MPIVINNFIDEESLTLIIERILRILVECFLVSLDFEADASHLDLFFNGEVEDTCQKLSW